MLLDGVLSFVSTLSAVEERLKGGAFEKRQTIRKSLARRARRTPFWAKYRGEAEGSCSSKERLAYTNIHMYSYLIMTNPWLKSPALLIKKRDIAN